MRLLSVAAARSHAAVACRAPRPASNGLAAIAVGYACPSVEIGRRLLVQSVLKWWWRQSSPSRLAVAAETGPSGSV
jgi:hypothetical protein